MVWGVSVAVPGLLVTVLYLFIAHHSLLLALAFDVLVLYLTLGFRQFSHFFTDIRDALDRGDEATARRLPALPRRRHPGWGPGKAWQGQAVPEDWILQPTQKVFSRAGAKPQFRHQWRWCDAEGKAHLQAVQGPGAAAWLQLAPEDGVALSAGSFAAALAYRLRLPLGPADPGACRCCGQARAIYGNHAQSCLWPLCPSDPAAQPTRAHLALRTSIQTQKDTLLVSSSRPTTAI